MVSCLVLLLIASFSLGGSEVQRSIQIYRFRDGDMYHDPRDMRVAGRVKFECASSSRVTRLSQPRDCELTGTGMYVE